MTKKSVKPSKETKLKKPSANKGSSIKDLKGKIKSEEEKYLRLFAEFENYKKRTTKERIDLFKTAGKEVIQGLIPVLEDFKRAVNPQTGKFDDLEGINLIYNKLSETLKTQGLVEIRRKLEKILIQKSMKQ